jgi:hypothetical protein
LCDAAGAAAEALSGVGGVRWSIRLRPIHDVGWGLAFAKRERRLGCGALLVSLPMRQAPP